MTQIVTDAQELEDVQSLFGSPSRAQANLQLPSETQVTDPDEMEEVLVAWIRKTIDKSLGESDKSDRSGHQRGLLSWIVTTIVSYKESPLTALFFQDP